MRRLLVLVIAFFTLLPGVAAARDSITFTLEYTGSYWFHGEFDSTTGGSTTEDERFTWSYRGTASLDPARAISNINTPQLHGKLAIQGTRDYTGGSSSAQHCTLTAQDGDAAPGHFTAGEFGVSATWATNFPSSSLASPDCVQTDYALCEPGNCALGCEGAPPAVLNDQDADDPAWAPRLGPEFIGESLGAETTVALKPGAGDFSTSCLNGTETDKEHLELTGHIAVGLSWSGPSLFIAFPDGAPPELQPPGTPLEGRRTPTVDIPPKVPQPPTQGATDPPLVSIGVSCPRKSRSCPVQVKVTAGTRTVAGRRFTGLKGGVTALAGLKLSKLKLGSTPKRVKVTVAVRTGKTTHRRSRMVTLSR